MGCQRGPVSGDARVWEAETGKELPALQGHTGHGYEVACSPDGRRRVTAGSDRLLKVRDATEGRQLVSLKGHAGPVLGVALAPDGAGLATASADETVRPWPLPPEARPPASLASDGNTAKTKEAGEASRSPAGPQP
jgi:WD40 repeat protein